VNENTTNGARRAEDILPGGFVPSHLAKPMLRAASTTQLEYVAEGLLDISVASALLSGPIEDAANRHKLADDIHTESRRLYRLVKALAAGALGLAVLAGVVLSPAGGSTAQAAEGPEPDPVAAVSAPATVRVTLGAAPVTVWVRATVYTEKAPGWFCASVWTARGRVGGTCSIGRTFPIPVTIDPRTFPVGRTFAQVVDDATDVAVSNVTIDARRPSRFGQGTWLDLGRGDEFVSAPLAAYTASSRGVDAAEVEPGAGSGARRGPLGRPRHPHHHGAGCRVRGRPPRRRRPPGAGRPAGWRHGVVDAGHDADGGGDDRAARRHLGGAYCQQRTREPRHLPVGAGRWRGSTHRSGGGCDEAPGVMPGASCVRPLAATGGGGRGAWLVPPGG
jgi:hypothetical protein